MDQRNSNNSNSPFLDLASDGYKKQAKQGEIQIFSESLQRKPSAESRQQAYNTAKSDYAQHHPRKRKSKRRKSTENRNVTLSVIMIYAVVGFFVGSLMIMRYSNIIKMDDELDTIEVQIEEMSARAEQLRLEVSLQDDIGMVQAVAKDRLNMYYPKNDQIVYVEITDDGAAETETELMQNDITMQ